MSYKYKKLDVTLWEKLGQLANLPPHTPWQQVAGELNIPIGEARRLMVALQDAQRELALHTGQSEEVFQAWSWPEWCEMTHLLETLVEKPELDDVRSTVLSLLKQQRQHPAYSVYLQLRQHGQEHGAVPCGLQVADEQGEFMEHKIRLIEEAILAQESILVECMKGKLWSLIPCKLTYLEGAMTLIAEEQHDHGLMSLQLPEIKNIKRAHLAKAPRAGVHAVAEFISALRAMADNEIRLVLKIRYPDQFQLRPDYQFLGKPCLVTNADGDIIWAAWVEPSDELFEWLLSMEQHVEILEPGDFILDFAAYCEEKLRKIA